MTDLINHLLMLSQQQARAGKRDEALRTLSEAERLAQRKEKLEQEQREGETSSK